MKRKRLTAVLAAVLAFSLAACGGSAASAANSGETVASSGGDYDLRLVNGKVEVDEQLKELAAAYEAETGVRVQIESMGGGVDIQGTLKGYYQADNMPDIFVNGGARNFANWEGLLADLGDEAWAADTEAAYVDEDAGLERDDTTYLDLLSDGGKIDPARFEKYAEMIALFNRYSDPALLVSGTYDRQILNFSSGKYAFVTQGSRIGATMTTVDAEAYEAAGRFKVGMLPYAFEDGIDTIQTSSPSWWAVYENENTDKAKAFLAWCAGDKGQEILVKKAGFISPFISCPYVADDPFAETVSAYLASGKTSAWHFLGNKEGIAQNALGVVYQDFALGELDTEGFIRAVTQVCYQYYNW